MIGWLRCFFSRPTILEVLMSLQTKIDDLTAQLTREHDELTAALGRLSGAFDVLKAEIATLTAQAAGVEPPIDTTALEAAVANVTNSANAVQALVPPPEDQ